MGPLWLWENNRETSRTLPSCNSATSTLPGPQQWGAQPLEPEGQNKQQKKSHAGTCLLKEGCDGKGVRVLSS